MQDRIENVLCIFSGHVRQRERERNRQKIIENHSLEQIDITTYCRKYIRYICIPVSGHTRGYQSFHI